MENYNINVEKNTTTTNSHDLPILNTMDEAVNLLVSWNLSQLCDKFREEEVCTEAFQHITDTDICELVPKLGPRSIFRARLSEWRQKKQELSKDQIFTWTYNVNQSKTVTTAKTASNNTNPIVTIPVKMETADAEDQWLQEAQNMQECSGAQSLLGILSSAPTSSRHVEHDIEVVNESDFLHEEENATNNSSVSSQSASKKLEHKSSFNISNKNDHEVLNVKEILNNCTDGRRAIAYYQTRNTIEPIHRKKIVKSVINVAIEKHLHMSVNCFYNLAHQFVELFPSENLDTYYVARTGSACPKGSLYNKYLNQCRRLRKEGALGYRIQRRSKLD